MSEAKWEHFPHGADVGVRGIAPSKEEAFEQAALALTAVVIDPSALTLDREVEITVEASNDELLLVEWLNAIVYEMAVRKMLFGRFKVAISDSKLKGRALGQRLDEVRTELGTEVKGATYTELKVVERNGSWLAQCVVDV
jgi:SHS2 domain-containing protein